MPIYEYQCNQCNKCFEQLVFASDTDEVRQCPHCGKKDTSRILSSFSCGSSASGEGLGSSLSSGCSPSGGFS